MAENNIVSSTGEEIESDTTVVVNLSDMRKANIKMIERDYYFNISQKQDTIIKAKNYLIGKQFDIIDDLENKVNTAYQLKKQAEENISKANKRNKIITYCGSSVIVGLIIGILVK